MQIFSFEFFFSVVFVNHSQNSVDVICLHFKPNGSSGSQNVNTTTRLGNKLTLPFVQSNASNPLICINGMVMAQRVKCLMVVKSAQEVTTKAETKAQHNVNMTVGLLLNNLLRISQTSTEYITLFHQHYLRVEFIPLRWNSDAMLRKKYSATSKFQP